MARPLLSLSAARRIALAAQGFDRARPRKVGAQDLARTIRRLGLLQIDSVNVLVPAHYQVLFSRLGPFERARLDRLLYGGKQFTEHWAHEASFLPIDALPLLRHRMNEHERRWSALKAFGAKHKDYADKVLEI